MPLTVAYTQQFARANWAFLLRQWAWAGIAPRQPRVTFFGARVRATCQPPFGPSTSQRQILMSIFNLSKQPRPHISSFCGDSREKFSRGFRPSWHSRGFRPAEGPTASHARGFHQRRTVISRNSSEDRTRFRRPHFDSYGMTEYCGLIHQCEHGQMHLVPEYGFLEILDDNDEPVGPDEEGYFVWTGFLNARCP